jgi:hypothetical protein
MTGLIVPRHMAASVQARKEGAVADSIKKSGINRLTSDDFLSPSEVQQQIDQLNDYILFRRETQPDYSLPFPSGWKLAVLMLTIPETSEGGVHIVDELREARSTSSPQGIIIGMGPAAYTDPDRFSIKGEMAPWHEVGDRILWVKYDATMFQVANGQRIGFMNDTQPMATIDKGWRVPQ